MQDGFAELRVGGAWRYSLLGWLHRQSCYAVPIGCRNILEVPQLVVKSIGTCPRASDDGGDDGINSCSDWQAKTNGLKGLDSIQSVPVLGLKY